MQIKSQSYKTLKSNSYKKLDVTQKAKVKKLISLKILKRKKCASKDSSKWKDNPQSGVRYLSDKRLEFRIIYIKTNTTQQWKDNPI